MTEIRVTYSAKDVDEVGISTMLYVRFLGIKGRAAILFSFILPLVLGIIIIHNMTSLNMWANEVLAVVFLLYGSIICWMIVTRMYLQRLRRVVDAAWFRNQDLTWVLSPQGCTLDGGPLWPWSEMTGLHYFKATTVLDFSIRKAVALPDHALPDGLIPDALAAQIHIWRHQ